ncbi:MAG: N-acetylglucosamine-6-phosphate deacetylase [Acidimicrobiaceae bacterium]|nr:N-acetylglucosamine-6-phosphate deacetylase [Acidimicrobiaceae bacterium]
MGRVTLFRDCRLVLPGRVIECGWLQVRGGAIAALGEGDPPQDTRDLAAEAVGESAQRAHRTIVPGFVDLHVHGGGGRRFEEGNRGATEEVVQLHRVHGTTTQLASVCAGQPESMLAATASLRGLVAEGLLAGIHLEGPFLSRVRCGAQDPASLRAPDLKLLAELLSAGEGTVRVVTVAPELPGALRLVEAIVDVGGVVAIGHTDASYSVTMDAIEAGARVATHLFNGMRPIHHREPGVVVAVLEDERVVLELVNDGYHLADPIMRMAWRLAGPQRIALVTDAMEAAGVGDGLYGLGEHQVLVEAGRAMLADGSSLAGSSLTMDRALQRAVVNLGVSLLDAVQAASTVPARVLGMQGDRGALATGLRADLVVLNEELDVEGVMIEGQWVDRTREAPKPADVLPRASAGERPVPSG